MFFAYDSDATTGQVILDGFFDLPTVGRMSPSLIPDVPYHEVIQFFGNVANTSAAAASYLRMAPIACP